LIKNIRQQTYKSLATQWFPAIVAGIFIFIVPPVGIAIIAAYFTAPILLAVRTMTKLPLTIATFFVMISMLFIFSTFSFIALHGLMDTVPLLEKHLSTYTGNTNFTGRVIKFLEDKIIEYGHALLEYAITFTAT